MPRRARAHCSSMMATRAICCACAREGVRRTEFVSSEHQLCRQTGAQSQLDSCHPFGGGLSYSFGSDLNYLHPHIFEKSLPLCWCACCCLCHSSFWPNLNFNTVITQRFRPCCIIPLMTLLCCLQIAEDVQEGVPQLYNRMICCYCCRCCLLLLIVVFDAFNLKCDLFVRSNQRSDSFGAPASCYFNSRPNLTQQLLLYAVGCDVEGLCWTGFRVTWASNFLERPARTP